MVVCSSAVMTQSSGVVTDLFDMLACIPEEPELWSSGQSNRQCILGRREFLNVKDFVVRLQED